MKNILKMKNKFKILRIIHSLDPAGGGPQNAIIDNSKALTNEDIDVHILTSDTCNKVNTKSKKIKIFNMGPSFGNYGLNFRIFFWLLRNKKKYDAVIIHELWRFYNLLARIFIKKYFVFAHGQLDPFFKLNYFKALKKKIYWFLIEKKNLLHSKSLLLTSDLEKKQINKTYVNTHGIKKTIVTYGILKPKINKKKTIKLFYKKFPKLYHKPFLLFMSRFHEKKGCEILIKSVKKILNKDLQINILLAGPGSAYKNKIKNLSQKLNLEQNLFWSDTLTGNLKWGAILSSQAMVLPSHGENFGVALVESLSCQRPVLTTNKVCIYKIIKNYKAGFISENSENSFTNILIKYLNLNKNQIRKIRKNSEKCFDENFNLKKNNKFALFLKKKLIE
tara:strand:+ start:1420 stop:2589 length:1170 start_codon:yes stop_codon:yes gene_type:complete